MSRTVAKREIEGMIQQVKIHFRLHIHAIIDSQHQAVKSGIGHQRHREPDNFQPPIDKREDRIVGHSPGQLARELGGQMLELNGGAADDGLVQTVHLIGVKIWDSDAAEKMHGPQPAFREFLLRPADDPALL